MDRPASALLAVALLSVALTGCDDEDPLDPDLLAALARGRGDAMGNGFTGLYVGEFGFDDCTCSTLEGPNLDAIVAALPDNPQDQCRVAFLQGDALTGGIPGELAASVVQADGFLAVEWDTDGQTFQLTGPIQADGTITVASAFLTGAVSLGEVRATARLDGILRQSEGGPILEGVLRQGLSIDAFNDQARCRSSATLNLSGT